MLHPLSHPGTPGVVILQGANCSVPLPPTWHVTVFGLLALRFGYFSGEHLAGLRGHLYGETRLQLGVGRSK